MAERSRGTIDELRLANLVQDYDELERELESPDPLLSSYSCGNVTHNCNNKCCADPSRHNLLYRRTLWPNTTRTSTAA